MISLKKEVGVCENVCDSLNEDQVAAADLVVANAQSPANSGHLLSSGTNQRVIQVMRCTSNSSSAAVNSSSPRYCQLRPLQPMQLNSTPTSMVSSNSAFQYARSVTPLTSQVIKNQPIMEFTSSKMANQTNQLLTPGVSGNVALGGPSIHSPGPAFGMSMAQASLQLNNSGVGVSIAVSAPSGGTPHTPNDSSLQSRKPCNCTKSHCLKLYCDCFAQGQLCQSCNCTNCMNNLQYEEERARVIKMTLDRNPMAFHPKIGRGDGERKHTKGCNCKKSGCLKNYCECYEAKISCTELCRCQGCKNTDDGTERRSLMRLSMMSQTMKARQQVHSRKNFVGPVQETEKVMENGEGPWSSSVVWDSSGNVKEAAYNRHATSPTVFGSYLPEAKTPLLPPAACLTAGFGGASEAGTMPPVSSSNEQPLSYPPEAAVAASGDAEQKRATTDEQVGSCCSYTAFLEGGSNEMISPEDALPHNFITWEVAEACCGCMLAQADDAERRDMLPAAQERIILEEFGRCLGQIVESACKALPLSAYPQHYPTSGLTLSGPGNQCAMGGHPCLVLHPGASGALMPMGEMSAAVNDENVMVDV